MIVGDFDPSDYFTEEELSKATQAELDAWKVACNTMKRLLEEEG